MADQKKGRRVFVIGVGMTEFVKPKSDVAQGPHYPDLAKVAVERAVADACINIKEVESASVGNMFQNGAGQRSLYPAGLTGIPINNVHNACVFLLHFGAVGGARAPVTL